MYKYVISYHIDKFYKLAYPYPIQLFHITSFTNGARVRVQIVWSISSMHTKIMEKLST